MARKVSPTPSLGTRFPHQDTAPWPWVTFLPSERAMALESVDFEAISHELRYEMSFGPHIKKFKNVCFVMVDYGILPATNPQRKNPIVMYEGQTYSKNYESDPERYILKVSFFEGASRPPQPPSFEETMYMKTEKAPPQEALHLMASQLVQDILVSPLKKITVDLD